MEKQGQIGDVGSYDVQVDEKGNVVLSAKADKAFEGGSASLELKVNLSIFSVLEKIAAKTATPWDDGAVKAAEKLLGIAQA